MTKKIHIALLRGVNVGGKRMVAMADLRNLLTRMGFSEVQSLLQSGNLVFRADAQESELLERRLEAEAAKRLALKTEFFVRTAEQWIDVIARNPFREEARGDPGHLIVMFLKDAPKTGDLKAIQAAIVGRELIRARGRHAYVVYPDGVGRSRLTHTLLEKSMGTRGTGRNWNTVVKLAELAGA